MSEESELFFRVMKSFSETADRLSQSVDKLAQSTDEMILVQKLHIDQVEELTKELASQRHAYASEVYTVKAKF